MSRQQNQKEVKDITQQVKKDVEKAKQGKSAVKKIIGLSMTCINPFIAIYTLKQAINYIHLIQPYFNMDKVDISTFEGKTNFIILFAFYFSAFYAAVILITIFFRVLLFKGDPVFQKDPAIIVACQRVLTNSLEQLVVFLPNLAYFLFNTAQSTDKKMIITWAALFLFSRIFFASGYVFGSAIGFSLLRQTGFLIGLFLSILLLVHNLGIYNTLSFIS